MDTLVTSKSGKRHIFVLVDRLTKFTRLIAMQEAARSEHVIKLFMDNWVRDFGLPKTIVTDRDVYFTSEIWKKATEQMGSQLHVTSGNHPEANGQAEQMNRVVQHVLRHYITPNQDDWDEKLRLIPSLYNNVVHGTTGISPNQLHLRWKPRSALDFLLLENRSAATPRTIEFGVQYEKLLQQVVKHINKSQEAITASENKHGSPHFRCEAAFEHMKNALTHHEVLKLPDPDKPSVVTTDASQYGIGAVLVQQEGKKLRSVEYISKKMPSQKLATSTYEKELYAVHKALTHWRHYLLGRFFYVRTDHQTLKWVRTQPMLSNALKRWIEVIGQYDFEPQYIKALTRSRASWKEQAAIAELCCCMLDGRMVVLGASGICELGNEVDAEPSAGRGGSRGFGAGSAEGEGGHDTPSSQADYKAGPTPEVGSGIGLGSTSIGNIAARTCTDDEMPSMIAEHLRGPVLASARPSRPPSTGARRQQTSMVAFVVHDLQKEFDQAIASFFFANTTAFNAARSDSYKNMERIMNEAARSRKMLKLSGYNFLRTKALPAEPHFDDRRYYNDQQQAGHKLHCGRGFGALMVKSVDMEGKDKSAPALARMWEEVIRELWVHRVNAICTDSAQVNISIRKILADHADSAMRSIPWVPCACHVFNLLMCDIALVPWTGEVILQGREITTFIKRHQRALAMFRRAGGEYKTQLGIKDGRPLELIQPRETRFGPNFVMLQRLREVDAVLLATVSHACWDDSPWDRTAASRARACKDLIRDPAWWLAVKGHGQRQEDGDAGVVFGDHVGEEDGCFAHVVMKKVKGRVRMMALPVHAAAWMLHPLHRSPRLFDNLEFVEIMNTLAHFAAVYTKNSREYKECWRSLESFHHKTPEWIQPNSEEALACTHVSPAQWWLTYGKNHKSLQKIVVAVLSMWTTASPCERNWSTFDLIHTNRRNLLSLETRDHITMPEEGVRSRRRTSILGVATSVQGTASLLGAQLTRHRRPTLEEAGTARGTTPGGSAHVPLDSDAMEADTSVGADMDGPIVVAPAEADAVIDAQGDDPVGEHGDNPASATATDGVVSAVDDGVVGADTGTDNGPIASSDGFSTPDPRLRLGERFASLL
ncbi:hypothetical protein CBR_g19364 [Chara braunii]|uniref:Integrase catalytic domain-containing protein n=1 Tax=Chara braunii TaxID=69332 RepID=A0A388KXT5_CHABU|nr:hypothetical protein CBR_g19364 [Chara braunii]|eukprot:GBG74851.1 hypothetical protein CBR_g19364 [Chara braunii]